MTIIVHYLFFFLVTAMLSANAVTKAASFSQQQSAAVFFKVRGGASSSSTSAGEDANQSTITTATTTTTYGRISADEFRLTPDQIETFHRQGCLTVDNVLTEDEVAAIEQVFDGFMTTGSIPPPPGKDFCDMSKPFRVPVEEWSIVNCMLPTRYYPPLQGNVYERLANSMARQLFPTSDMVKDYDQLLNKRPGKTDAVFAWHQDMGYWPHPQALGMAATDRTDTCTFSLAIDDSDEANGCLRYVAGSGAAKVLHEHKPLSGGSREEGHALCVHVDETKETIRLAPAKRGSLTIHDEWVVHGSAGNSCPDRQRRTYVVAFRAKEIVDAERRIGFTHSHNDKVNWDTFLDGASHRVATAQGDANEEDQGDDAHV